MRQKACAAALLTIGVFALACGREIAPGAPSLTSATPRPEATVPTTRTIDNAGFVDNGGRTSDETNRSEMSGMRATEAGSERPTGTPGSGTPIPIPTPRGAAPPPTRGEGAGAASSERGTTVTSTGGPVVEAGERLARARCDRETTCNRIGRGRAWATQDQCFASQRERVGDAVSALGCPHGIDNVQLAICLNALRGQACSDGSGDLSVLPECMASALCSP